MEKKKDYIYNPKEFRQSKNEFKSQKKNEWPEAKKKVTFGMLMAWLSIAAIIFVMIKKG